MADTPARSLSTSSWRSALQHLGPGAGGVVMGTCGLALAWLQAQPVLGESAGMVGRVLGGWAGLLALVLAAALLLRARLHPQAWAADVRHPVRHALPAMLSAALILLVTVAVALWDGDAPAPLRWLWRLAALVHGGLTLQVLGRWWRAGSGGTGWAPVTPLLFVPIVGNVLVPLAGVPLGQEMWSAAQFGIGLLFWPLVLAMLLLRLVLAGPWPERLLPANLIVVAPPAVIGLALLKLGAPEAVAQGLWGVALFALLWVGPGLRRLASLPFTLTHWALSFPLTALAALTLCLASGPGPLQVLALLLLALSTLVVAALSLATWRGLRAGTLLVPEPVAVITPVAG